MTELQPIPHGCGRCEKDIFGSLEGCWFCGGSLCPECWEKVGHCGHKRAEAANEAAAKVKQPEPKP